jgi:hypothetical protein
VEHCNARLKTAPGRASGGGGRPAPTPATRVSPRLPPNGMPRGLRLSDRRTLRHPAPAAGFRERPRSRPGRSGISPQSSPLGARRGSRSAPAGQGPGIASAPFISVGRAVIISAARRFGAFPFRGRVTSSPPSVTPRGKSYAEPPHGAMHAAPCMRGPDAGRRPPTGRSRRPETRAALAWTLRAEGGARSATAEPGRHRGDGGTAPEGGGRDANGGREAQARRDEALGGHGPAGESGGTGTCSHARHERNATWTDARSRRPQEGGTVRITETSEAQAGSGYAAATRGGARGNQHVRRRRGRQRRSAAGGGGPGGAAGCRRTPGAIPPSAGKPFETRKAPLA